MQVATRFAGKIYSFRGVYGFIEIEPNESSLGGGRIFFHCSQVPADYRPAVGDPVSFEFGAHDGRVCAVNVRPNSLGDAAVAR